MEGVTARTFWKEYRPKTLFFPKTDDPPGRRTILHGVSRARDRIVIERKGLPIRAKLIRLRQQRSILAEADQSSGRNRVRGTVSGRLKIRTDCRWESLRLAHCAGPRNPSALIGRRQLVSSACRSARQSLIVGEEKRLVLADWPARRSAELIVAEDSSLAGGVREKFAASSASLRKKFEQRPCKLLVPLWIAD